MDSQRASVKSLLSSFFRRKPVNPKEHKPVEVTQWRFHVRKTKKNSENSLSVIFLS